MNCLRSIGLASYSVLALHCYRSGPPDGSPYEPDAAVTADAAPGDAAVEEYDCRAACARTPPICQPEEFPGGPTCETVCARYAFDHGDCSRGEGRLLISCMAEHPGSCDSPPESPCVDQWYDWIRCGPG